MYRTHSQSESIDLTTSRFVTAGIDRRELAGRWRRPAARDRFLAHEIAHGDQIVTVMRRAEIRHHTRDPLTFEHDVRQCGQIEHDPGRAQIRRRAAARYRAPAMTSETGLRPHVSAVRSQSPIDLEIRIVDRRDHLAWRRRGQLGLAVERKAPQTARVHAVDPAVLGIIRCRPASPFRRPSRGAGRFIDARPHRRWCGAPRPRAWRRTRKSSRQYRSKRPSTSHRPGPARPGWLFCHSGCPASGLSDASSG